MKFEYPFAFLIIFLFLLCVKFCNPKKDAMIFPHFFKVKKFPLLEFLIVLFLSIALASPIKIERIYSNKFAKDFVIDLDTSGSMTEFNKLNFAKMIIKDFAKKRVNDRLALVVFGNISYIASPLTFDKEVFNTILDKIYPGIAGEKTAIYDSLFLSANLLKKSKRKIIILLTDGMDNASLIPKDVVLNKLIKNHIKVYTIGIGLVDKNILKEIASKTKGKFFLVNSFEELKRVYDEIDKLEKESIKTFYIKINYYFTYPLFIALLLFSYLLYRRKNLWSF